MPEIQAFRGIRYNLGHIGSLSEVVAPPYDVIDPALQDELYTRHPSNIIRVILNREEPGDDSESRYDRAAWFFKSWQAEGVLETEGDPAIYVYHQEFQHEGQTFTRRGFMARMRLQRFGEGNIYPHEETHSKAKADRLKLTKACQANCSQIFGLYPDSENAAQGLLDEAIAGVAGTQATDHLGVKHQLWQVTDVKTITEVSALLGNKPMFVADGHHRYETACNYRDHLIQQQGPLPQDHPANFVMTMCVSMNDPGMIVLPTHRLLRGTLSFTSDEIVERLGDHFRCSVLGSGPELATDVWEQMEVEDRQGLLALYGVKDQRWVLCDATDLASERLGQLESERTEDWRGLGVSLLHRLVIDELLDCAGHPKPTYVHQIDEIVQGLKGEGTRSEEESNDPYTLAAIVMPAKVSDVEAISLNQERMPAKSTYFYPKLLSGLVLNPLT